jgi:hypothetical protein
LLVALRPKQSTVNPQPKKRGETREVEHAVPAAS